MRSTLSQEIASELAATAKTLSTPGKGILAADESTGTIGKRFDSIKLENNESNRAYYRELLFTTKGLGEYISGAILFEETLYQTGPNTKKSMVDLLRAEGILPGIKVDLGVVTLPQTDDEKATQGLDNLGERCQKYYKQGARFAKWRAVLSMGKNKPSQLSITETAHTLARYAAVCQENKLVPIVEPELLADGPHTIEECAEATEKILAAVFHALNLHHVLIEGCVLKPNMVTSGYECSSQAKPQEVGFYTVRTLSRTIPAGLPGVFFLSGGQSEESATLNLNAMNMISNMQTKLSFSFGRALQASCIKTWAGKAENLEKAQSVLLGRAKANSEAQLGKYKGGAASASETQSLYEKKYVY